MFVLAEQAFFVCCSSGNHILGKDLYLENLTSDPSVFQTVDKNINASQNLVIYTLFSYHYVNLSIISDNYFFAS